MHAWARATPLGSLRVVYGPANESMMMHDDGDDNTMYAECAVAWPAGTNECHAFKFDITGVFPALPY